jgi:hypothetical protein
LTNVSTQLAVDDLEAPSGGIIYDSFMTDEGLDFRATKDKVKAITPLHFYKYLTNNVVISNVDIRTALPVWITA